MYQLLSATQYLHSGNVIHRDQKPSNILLDTECNCKIADFGLGRRDISDDCPYEMMTERALPLKWMAPEAISGEMISTPASDVWSFGVLAWEVLSLARTPYGKGPIQWQNMLSSIKEGKRLEKPTGCPDNVYSIIQGCWKLEPSARTSFSVLRLEFASILSR